MKTKLPLLFMPNRQVKIVLVTEGAWGEVSRAEIDQVKRHVLSPGNIFMYRFLYTIFNGKFRPDGDIEREPSTAYWTHMRKCFMKGEKSQILTACSEAYLRDEIRLVKPSLIIAIGGCAKMVRQIRSNTEISAEDLTWEGFLGTERSVLQFRRLGARCRLLIGRKTRTANTRIWTSRIILLG
jgi:hypothetical protein